MTATQASTYFSISYKLVATWWHGGKVPAKKNYAILAAKYLTDSKVTTTITETIDAYP